MLKYYKNRVDSHHCYLILACKLSESSTDKLSDLYKQLTDKLQNLDTWRNIWGVCKSKVKTIHIYIGQKARCLWKKTRTRVRIQQKGASIL